MKFNMSMAYLTVVLAVSALAYQAVAVESDSITAFARQESFPYCRCSDYSYVSNPYVLDMTSTEVQLTNFAGYGDICFKIKFLGLNFPKPNPTDCYKKLAARLHKIQFSIQPACPAGLDLYGKNVTLNGVQLTGVTVENYPAGSLLKVTNLGLTGDTAHGSTICIRTAYPCSTPENFFTQLPALYDLEESGAHRCCVWPRRG